MPAHHVIAVDWSGRKGAGQAEAIWVAEVVEGQLVELRNGLTRGQIVGHLVSAAERTEGLTVGLDFSFSFPAWWMRERGFATVREAWRLAAEEGESLLAARTAPFWGAAGSTALPEAKRFRRTEVALRTRGLPPKSVFQLAGPGAVGVGSLRGMPHLLTLAEKHGFGVWPFDSPRSHRVVEIYPRAFTGPVDKGRWRSRHEHLQDNFGGAQDPQLLERAAGSEDAFDAAVSALVMGSHVEALAGLARGNDETELLEGRIWVPN